MSNIDNQNENLINWIRSKKYHTIIRISFCIFHINRKQPFRKSLLITGLQAKLPYFVLNNSVSENNILRTISSIVNVVSNQIFIATPNEYIWMDGRTASALILLDCLLVMVSTGFLLYLLVFGLSYNVIYDDNKRRFFRWHFAGIC